MPFCNHLCPDQNINFSPFKPRIELYELIFAACRISVHSGYSRLWENFLYFLLHFLCSDPESFDTLPAVLAIRNRSLRKAAHMTFYRFILNMVSKRNSTVRTLQYLSAAVTNKKSGVTPSVKKQYCLLALFEIRN